MESAEVAQGGAMLKAVLPQQPCLQAETVPGVEVNGRR